MAADVGSLADDVQAEHDALADGLRGLGEDAWSTPTPAPRWTVRDQVTHLAFFDHVTRLAIAEPAAFEALRAEAEQDLESYVDGRRAEAADRSGPEMLDWWARERTALLDAARAADPRQRVPWFGPSMSLASKLTARVMETWAHGQDVVDALGLVRPPTARLHHVARIGVLAFPNSFRANGRPVPEAGVRVVLTAPGGGTWEWGERDAPDSVSGPAEDFCLVVTQRRHLDDTSLVVTGPVAMEWMSIAQAFAGAPGEGRAPGQFSRPEDTGPDVAGGPQVAPR